MSVLWNITQFKTKSNILSDFKIFLKFRYLQKSESNEEKFLNCETEWFMKIFKLKTLIDLVNKICL